MRPLWYEFPDDPNCVGVNDQYLLGPKYLLRNEQCICHRCTEIYIQIYIYMVQPGTWWRQ